VTTYYEVLGVPFDAAHDVVRQAYLTRARRLHPDRVQGLEGSDANEASRRMQDVNEAWRVLGDPARRAAYDRSLAARDTTPARPPSPATGSRTTPVDPDLDTPIAHPLAEPGDLGISIVRMVPWVAVAIILVAIFVFTAYAGPSRSTGELDAYVGGCVSISARSSITSLPCESPNDGEVVRVVATYSGCPSGSTARRVEGGWLCLAPTTVR
jgi:curved DNA-binding protein CbpA